MCDSEAGEGGIIVRLERLYIDYASDGRYNQAFQTVQTQKEKPWQTSIKFSTLAM